MKIAHPEQRELAIAPPPEMMGMDRRAPILTRM
jgi:hypothetical protein